MKIRDCAYGGVIFKLINNRLHVLLVKKPQYISWDLPKGHKKTKDKNEIDAVKREVGEETGYWETEIIKVCSVEDYKVPEFGKDYWKRVTFYFGIHNSEETPSPKADDDEGEKEIHAEWIAVEKARKLLKMPFFKNALEKGVRKYLALKKKSSN